jgi:chaperonin GroES
MAKTSRPLWGNVLIRPIKNESKTKSGLVLPDSIPQGNTLRGVVIAVGTGSISMDGTVIPMELHPADLVVFKKYEAEPVELEGEQYYLVDQRQVLSIVFE